MRIYCYYNPIGGFDTEREKALIDLWAASWRQHGYTPVVLGRDDAAKHPQFAEFNSRMERLPTVNGYAYEGACYHRWLAVQHALSETNETGLMSDYDVMAYSPIPSSQADLTILSLVGLPQNDAEGLERLGQTPRAPSDAVFAWVVPCLVLGTPAGFQQAVEMFMQHATSAFDWIWDKERRHTSDQFILTQLRYSGLFEVNHQCAEVFREGWRETAAVHYPNGVMVPRKLMPKHSHIIPLRKFFKEPNRLDIPRMAQQGGIIVEVGVATGRFTAYLADHYQGLVVGVDPYRVFDRHEWVDCLNSNQETLDAVYRDASRAFSGRQNVRLLRKTSLEASLDFPDDFLNCVFIDGNHMYEACKADLQAWWPKVKKGAFLCGHDYTVEDVVVTPHVTLGVGKAVREFCQQHQLEHTVGLGPDGMWLINKPDGNQ